MAIKTLYTAIGCLQRKKDISGSSYPVITLGGKEYMADLQEMLVWSSLNWRIARREEIKTLCDKALSGTECPSPRSLEACIDRLLTRGLIVSGSGETGYDALYDLLSTMYIIPADGSLPLRVLTFLKLTVLNRVPLSMTRKLFQTDKRTPDEEQVMQLARQTLLSTAEIIKCAEKNIRRLPTEESVVETLYDDQDTTSDNIACMVKASNYSQGIVMAVANLYLRQQIIFERV